MNTVLRRGTAQVRRGGRKLRGRLERTAGGPQRVKVVLILAGVLGLNGADQATISATANNLERAFGIGNTGIGLLVSVVALTGAVFTIPVGILTDRVCRTRLLAISVATWSVATLFSGMAMSYPWLLASRACLGAVSATAGPTVASLIGDYFPAGSRGRVYGLILSGDLVGTGIGFMFSGDIASALSWRFAFWWLVLPSLALAWLAGKLREPPRGGEKGVEQRPVLAADAVERTDIEPQPELILRADPAHRSVWWAVGYVLRVRTNVVIIVASALGYFFFAGLRSFAIIYAMGHYGLSKSTADAMVLVVGVGALAGVFAGGRISDRMLRRGNIRARIIVPLVCLLAIAPVLAAAIATTSVAVAVPLLILGAFLLGAPNPPMDAARLDIMHPRLWGRAEGVRTVLRTLGEAGAPLLFGFVSQYLFGGPGASAGSTGGGAHVAGASGLEYTFLLFLLPLLAAGLLVLPALRTYPRDVATANASVQAMKDGRPGDQVHRSADRAAEAPAGQRYRHDPPSRRWPRPEEPGTG